MADAAYKKQINSLKMLRHLENLNAIKLQALVR